MNKKNLLRLSGVTVCAICVAGVTLGSVSGAISQPIQPALATPQIDQPALENGILFSHDKTAVGKDAEAYTIDSVIALTPMPAVQTMLRQITTSTLRPMVGDLSGEWPALIGGEPYTISTRYMNTDPGPSNYPGYSSTLTHVTQYAFEHLATAGVYPQYQDWQLNSGWNGFFTSRNVIGQITGTVYPDDVFIISAHIDNYPPGAISPGADDNATGSAAALLAAKLMSQHSWNCTVRFALWTGEEVGLLGSYAHASAARAQNQNIRGMINMDALGWNGNPDRGVSIHVLRDLSESLAAAEMYSNVIGVYNLNLVPKILAYTGSGGYFSDHYYFWRQDYPAITIEEDSTDLNPNMNNPNDVAANIDFDYYTENVKAAIAALAHMAQCQNTRPLLPTRTPTPSPTPTPTNMPGTYSVGDYVWLDSNGDGLQNEMGTPGMDNIFMAILDSNGNLVKTTYSVGGRYYFRDLPPGQYQILFNCPQGYTFTIKSAAPYTNINSDVDSRGVATVTISTANQYDIDAGMVMLTATPTETPTITPTPTQTRTPSPTQTPSPTYTSTATPKPVYSLGNYVWVDSNANGLQDEAVEFGKDGVLIVLCDQNGVYLDYRFTAGGGFYTFANLSSATYILKFIAPTGFTFTIQNAFSNYVEYMDSDVDSAGVVTVTLGANSMDWIDAGLKALPPAIKTRVFVPNTMRGVAAAW